MSVVYTLLIGIFMLAGLTAQAQTSQQKSIKYKSISPATDHYKIISIGNPIAKGGELESIVFPEKEFRRGAYLKMRTVYLDMPVNTFKIKPYPANSSEQTRQELDFLLELQQKRTAADAALTDTMAIVYYDPYTVNPNEADYSRNVNSLFYVGRNLGPWFTPQQLPVTSRVLQNVIQDATFYFFSLKAQFNRARPYHLEPALQNLEAPGHASYPSGHSSASHVHAYLLSHLLPAYKDAFLANAYDMAFSREIRGVHYPSDSEAGREFAEQFVTQLLKNKKFKADLEAMKAEIHKAMAANKLSSVN
ncbi:phosphatase PAP2 family protein [Pontibacter aydingkolensis]|uniref:Phosphatase PAP2 family protein n=2 Tax=Pontibacter aydingkolensis TaxID=1911536 RepID=A0ABS7CXY3_9BACT|nr:phosphatase PAP2 family protein [Pontibacter aydingkolensis]